MKSNVFVTLPNELDLGWNLRYFIVISFARYMHHYQKRKAVNLWYFIAYMFIFYVR